MGYKQDRGTPPMERELNYLLYDLCVNWGFCINPVKAEAIGKEPSHTAEQFAAKVLEADGLNPLYERRWLRRIAARFEERFGKDAIDQQTFTDRIRGSKESW